MVSAVPLNISVNFTDQKNCGIKSGKSGKMPNFLCIISFHPRTIEDKLKLGMITLT